MLAPKAYDATRAVFVGRRNLPHLRQEGAVYYVTFRLFDSVAGEKLREWQHELESLPKEQHRTHTARRMEKWLDLGHGSCLLEKPGVAEQVRDSLLFFDTRRYLLDWYVVMPNHVHVLVMPLPGYELSDIAHSWKSYTAHEINKLLSRNGELWQHEPFDHIVRDTAALQRFRRYVQNNPLKLPGHRAILGHGSFAEMGGL